ncbi:hypothetical protein BS78_K254500 [Paspalum vaginatum]|uniref:Chalcone synthase n=1 Tax=Paspalum vaginatum TaxID=158149 RepID=A0A9W8CF22_9POAL|nr:hypothetical protein BS78_K254500 [Paspalum vaginatum]
MSLRQLLKKSTMAATTGVREIRCAQRGDGPAAVLGIGTANPAHCLLQDDFPDYYFRVTNKEHLTDLKDTFKKLCQATGLERRFFFHHMLDPQTKDEAQPSPGFLPAGISTPPDARLDMVTKAAPELAARAAAKAIARWGRPATDITHLVVSTNSEARSPGVDVVLASLLGLGPSVCRTALQLNGCSAGSAALRLAKDLAENNRGARVLVACVELTATSFRGPEQGDTFDTLIPQALFSDGAGAVVVGADAVSPAERPLFEMVSASQTLIPDGSGAERLLSIRLGLGEGGMIHGNASSKLPGFVGQHLERCLLDAFQRLGCSPPLSASTTWNDIFWVVHPGSRGILDHIDSALRLEPRKLAASRTVLRDYGNMLSATVIFVLDELRRRMEEEGDEAPEWGVMVGFGPGFTVETMVLHTATTH